MPGPYSAAQLAVAKESYAFWKGKGAPDWVCAAFLGSEDGETSFVFTARGDHDAAGGMSQWHKVRRDQILAHCGIDVWAPDHAKQLAGMYAEMTAPWSAYRHVWSALMATTDVEDAITILVSRFEQSANTARDILRRTGLANYWLKYAAANGW